MSQANRDLWSVDEALCIGCELCVDACPLDAIKLHPETGSAIKCDLCAGQPKCVERCPRGALSLFEEKPKFSPTADRMIKQHLAKIGLAGEQFLIP